jgi:hypothetical protein
MDGFKGLLRTYSKVSYTCVTGFLNEEIKYPYPKHITRQQQNSAFGKYMVPFSLECPDPVHYIFYLFFIIPFLAPTGAWDIHETSLFISVS